MSEKTAWYHMAGTVRSSLPSRLRQLLSGEGPIGPNVKLDSETVRFLPPFSNSSLPWSVYAWFYWGFLVFGVEFGLLVEVRAAFCWCCCFEVLMLINN